jgi:hypothetical protein
MLATVGVVILGLASRRYPGLLPQALGKYPGDALWALMVYLGVALLRPNARVRTVGLFAIAISFAVEFLQMYRAPWLVALRETAVGHLVLGSTFAVEDLVAYVVGVAMGIWLDWMLASSAAQRRRGAFGMRPSQ